MPDADAELIVELEHAEGRRVSRYYMDQRDRDFTTYIRSPPPCMRFYMKIRRRPGLQKGRVWSEYEIRIQRLLYSKEFSGRLRSGLEIRSGRTCLNSQIDDTTSSTRKEHLYAKTAMKQAGCTTACATAT